jgi:large subunit ribosomal protein L3
MKAILGQKVGMTRVYNDAGNAVPVTLVKVGPCAVTGMRTDEKDGYTAVQLGYRLNKKAKKDSVSARDYSFVREFKGFDLSDEIKESGIVDVNIFEVGDVVSVTGNTKGKGFTGVVKRHGFAGAPKTHGHKHDLRKPGSIGSAFPQHVVKGKKMAGRSGNVQVTTKNHQIVDIDPENNIIAVSGSIPGHRNTYLKVIASNS